MFVKEARLGLVKDKKQSFPSITKADSLSSGIASISVSETVTTVMLAFLFNQVVISPVNQPNQTQPLHGIPVCVPDRLQCYPVVLWSHLKSFIIRDSSISFSPVLKRHRDKYECSLKVGTPLFYAQNMRKNGKCLFFLHESANWMILDSPINITNTSCVRCWNIESPTW